MVNKKIDNVTKSDVILVILITAKDELIREDFIEAKGRNQLKIHYNQFFGLSSDQCGV